MTHVVHAVRCAALAALCGQPALAQIAPTTDQGETIVVTAQRRAQRAADVPISLTALSGNSLERMSATDMPSLDKVVPSLVMTRTGAFTQPYLRGVGKRSTLGVENGVATYVDGVYLASPISALLDLRGIDRIEVLNGPQGTLFGRNATGGVIQVITRDPTPRTSGEAELGVGEYGFVRSDVYLTSGNDHIAGNLAASLSTNGGYGTNLFTGKKDQGEIRHSLVARSKWIWRPGSSLKLTFAADYQDIDENLAYRPVPGFVPIGEPRSGDFQDADQDASARYRFRYGGVSVRADAAIGSLNFMSLTALRRMRALYGADLDLGPNPLLAAEPKARQDQFSQEFQLQSNASSRIQWVAGLYFIHLKEQYDPQPFSYGGSYSEQLGGRIAQTLFDKGYTTSYAAYGQATAPIADLAELTLGMRYTAERRSVRANGERLFDNPPFVRPIPGLPLLDEEPLRESVKFGEATWRASLDRHFSETIMGYVSASRGFQSGGWNLQTPQSPAYAPETINDFEAGLKYSSRSRRLSADVGLFYSRYSNLQVTAVTPIGSITANATSARIGGGEFQLSGKPDDETNVTVGVQLLKSRFDRFPNASCVDFDQNAAVPYAAIICDATGNRLPYAPKLKFNFGADRHISLRSAGSLVLSGNLAYNSGYFSEPDNVLRQKAFATLDARAEWRPNWRGPSIQLWALNLTNVHYFSGLTEVATAGALQVPAPPRRLGATLAYAF